MRAVRIHEHGGPEVLRYEEVPLPEPARGEVRVKVEAIGLNFLDTYYRSGLYQVSLPFIPGSEAAGVVDAVGPEVAEVRPGDRVGFAMYPGAYAEYAVVPAWRLVPLPAGIDARTAAAALVQGMTAHYLTHSTYAVKPGDTVLVHAAGGGTGQLLVQVAKRLGATVYGTASTAEKARLAREAGADQVILYSEEDFVEAIRHLTDGRGVDVVYDSVGKTTAERSMDCLRPRGYLVLFGNASGAPPAVAPLTLMAKGSLFLTRPSLAHYIATREELLRRAGALFDWVIRGEVKVRVARTYALPDAPLAHRDLEGRLLTGKGLLLP
ncbi:MAG: quinone oxidoreductase [Armatimonadota bacterium]|nr:quinone oxidoreductase [Armatimonadota bacterium]MDR7428320.1 quinone oxidoreductase [Armatimonadota bacterium]MDR7463401.1 quinone oxidoreductase [Armatimonadota bacterium]MDR7470228.1 quinone oxidoreductase [Armatimonadota bacterium]MDR7475580.1 quinone oxidoreductase [Armatimonadota bacterium]